MNPRRGCVAQDLEKDHVHSTGVQKLLTINDTVDYVRGFHFSLRDKLRMSSSDNVIGRAELALSFLVERPITLSDLSLGPAQHILGGDSFMAPAMEAMRGSFPLAL